MVTVILYNYSFNIAATFANALQSISYAYTALAVHVLLVILSACEHGL